MRHTTEKGHSRDGRPGSAGTAGRHASDDVFAPANPVTKLQTGC
jgi:hypothetical protein